MASATFGGPGPLLPGAVSSSDISWDPLGRESFVSGRQPETRRSVSVQSLPKVG